MIPTARVCGLPLVPSGHARPFKKIELPLPTEICFRYPETKEDTLVVKMVKPFCLMFRRPTKARLARILLTPINGLNYLLIYAQEKVPRHGRTMRPENRIGYCILLNKALGVNIARKSMRSPISNYIGQDVLQCLVEIKFKFGTLIFELDGEKRISQWCASFLKSYEPSILPPTPKLMFQEEQMELIEHSEEVPAKQSTSAEHSTSTALEPDEAERMTLRELHEQLGWKIKTEDDEEESNEDKDDEYETIGGLFEESTTGSEEEETNSAATPSTIIDSHSNEKNNNNRHRSDGKKHRQRRNAKKARHGKKDKNVVAVHVPSSEIGAPLASSSLISISCISSHTSDSSTLPTYTKCRGRRFTWAPNRQRRQTIVWNIGGGESTPANDSNQFAPPRAAQGCSRTLNLPSEDNRKPVAEELCCSMELETEEIVSPKWNNGMRAENPPTQWADPCFARPTPPTTSAAASPQPTKKQVHWPSMRGLRSHFVPKPYIKLPMQQTSSTFGYIVQRYGFSASNSTDNNGGLCLDQLNQHPAAFTNDQMLNVRRLFEERIENFLKERSRASSTSSTLKMPQPMQQAAAGMKYGTFMPQSHSTPFPAQLNGRQGQDTKNSESHV